MEQEQYLNSMVKVKHIELETKYAKVNYFDITEEIKNQIMESGIKNGVVTVQSEHTTCAIIFEEFVHDLDPKGDDFLQVDLNILLRRMIPDQTEFNDNYYYPGPVHLFRPDSPHFDYQGVRLNAPAHLKSTIIGASQNFVIEDGEIQTGKYGSIWFVDFDYNRPRKRRCAICIMGE